MKSNQAIKVAIDMGDMISMAYIDDLSDSELMKRPTPGCNHIKWQLGHLISSEHEMIDAVFPGSMPKLPTGFAEKYTKETAASDNAADFHSKAELLDAYKTQRAGTLRALEKVSDADFDKESPEAMRGYAPNVGAVFSMQGAHWMMHAGQWAVIRRQLGRKPIF